MLRTKFAILKSEAIWLSSFVYRQQNVTHQPADLSLLLNCRDSGKSLHQCIRHPMLHIVEILIPPTARTFSEN